MLWGASSKGSVPYMHVPGARQRDLRGEGQALRSGGDGGGFGEVLELTKESNYNCSKKGMLTVHIADI